MRLLNSSYEIWEQEKGLLGVYKQIEKAARTSYKSEDRITDDSAQKMVDALIKNKHYACLEHGTIYLKCDDLGPDEYGKTSCIIPLKGKYSNNPYSKVVYRYWDQKPTELQSEFCKTIPRTTVYVTTNARVIVENGWEDDLQYLCEPTEYHEKRITVKFVWPIGIVRDALRHRKFSFMNESTRYCNYSKDKFGRQISFIIPSWSKIKPGEYHSPTTVTKDLGKDFTFAYSCYNAEYFYFDMLADGATPQEAREVLPLSTKSDLIMTGFVEDWKHFFALRADGVSGPPHPNAKLLAEPLKKEFIKRGYI